MEDSIRKKLQLIKNLSESEGNENEKDSAQKKLMELLQKNGLTLDDLDPNGPKKSYAFPYLYKEEKKIIIQIISALANSHDIRFYTYKDTKKELYADLYEWQYKEAIPRVSWYLKQYRKEREAKIKSLTTAYIHKHKLFPDKKSDDKKSEAPNISREELQEIIAMMNSLEDHYYLKQLNE